MTYVVEHLFDSFTGRTTIRTAGGRATASFSRSGSMSILYPGQLDVDVVAGYTVRVRVQSPNGPPRFKTQANTVHCQVEVRTPDGGLFNGTQVTLNDIRRFRDLRGISHGTWTYKVSGESAPVRVDVDEFRVNAGDAFLRVAVLETITSKSAPPFANELLAANQRRRYGFDLWRVGTFTATARSGLGGVLGRPGR